MLESIGWIATALFTSSYFFRDPVVLRRVQAGAAVVWIAYGAAIGATPVVAANLIVAVAAISSPFLARNAGEVRWNPLAYLARRRDGT